MILFLSSAVFAVVVFLLFFQNQLFSRIPSECHTDWIQIRVQHIVGPDLGQICLQRLSADGTQKAM